MKRTVKKPFSVIVLVASIFSIILAANLLSGYFGVASFRSAIRIGYCGNEAVPEDGREAILC